jgi:hypothetical protein
MLFAAPLTIILLQYLNQKSLRAERDRVLAESQRAERSEAQTRKFYAADLNLAWKAFDVGDYDQARTLIDRHRTTEPRFELRLLNDFIRNARQIAWETTNDLAAAEIEPIRSRVSVLTRDALVSFNLKDGAAEHPVCQLDLRTWLYQGSPSFTMRCVIDLL